MPALIPSALALLSLAGTPAEQSTPVRPPAGTQLIGFGLVVGLDGTGGRSTFTQQVLLDLKLRLGCFGDERLRQLASRGLTGRPGPFRWPDRAEADNILRPGNTSAVMVVAELRAGANKGGKIDVTVISMDDARCLQGGVLILTPLKGADGEVYAIAQGALGSTSPEGTEGAKTAAIKNGGLVEKSPVR